MYIKIVIAEEMNFNDFPINFIIFHSIQLSGSYGKEFHFKHKALHHARTRRSIAHTRVLKKEPLVSNL